MQQRNIDEMPAGRAIDRLIEMRIMRLDPPAGYNPHYSTDISCAWDVVEQMRARGFRFSLADQPGTGIRIASFFNDAEYGAMKGAATDALAICYAALYALRATNAA